MDATEISRVERTEWWNIEDLIGVAQEWLENNRAMALAVKSNQWQTLLTLELDASAWVEYKLAIRKYIEAAARRAGSAKSWGQPGILDSVLEVFEKAASVRSGKREMTLDSLLLNVEDEQQRLTIEDRIRLRQGRAFAGILIRALRLSRAQRGGRE
jgi:hypothetical protein